MTPLATDLLTASTGGPLAGQAAVEVQAPIQADLIDDLREVLDEHKG